MVDLDLKCVQIVTWAWKEPLKRVEVNNRLSRKQHFNILLKNRKATICEKKKIKRKLRV